ncbi:MAG: immunoglobulin domain-containing protein [Akkermansiaceae bacterium]|nr:immunoglobulin domain-containing protein [Verrucomicrobiales bacterium]
MKWKNRFFNALAVTAMILSTATTASAGIYTWSAPTAISTADTTLNQSGTVVGAAVFGYDSKLVALGDGTTIYFAADGSVATATGDGTTYGAFTTNTTGNSSFNAVLTQFNYDGGPKTITLNNLVAGQQYAVQLFALDDRSPGTRARRAYFQDPADAANVSSTNTMGSKVYVIGTFTAPGTTVTIQENLPDGNGGNINALVIRAIGTNIPPQITSQPQPATIYNGQTATLTAGASGTGPLSYQWQKSNVGGSVFANLSNGGRFSGVTSNSLSISSLVAGDTADYRVVVTSSYGSVTSSPAATLTVVAGTPQFVWSDPAPITTADATLSLTGTVVGAAVFGTSPLVVTLTNGATIDFKTDGSTAAVTGGGFGTANGAFSGNTSNANFNAVLDQFTWDGGPHTITLNNLFVGQQYSVQLFALDNRGGASSALTANYQDPSDSANISTTFAMGDNLYTVGTFTASNTSVSIQQNLLMLNGSGNINAVVIRALGVIVAPQITTQPQPVTIDQGLTTPVKFTAAASGTAPLTYRWQRGAVGSGIFTNVPANARYVGLTSPSLIISNVVIGDQADYQVIAANAAGSATSTPPATLTVVAVTPQFVFSIPASITTADATLAQSGTIVGAEVFGPSPKIVVLANGTSVDFKNNGAVATATGDGTFTGAFTGNTSNANFNAVLNQASYENFGNPIKTITLNNLVAGQQYAAQLFALDDRNGTGGRTVNYQDPADAADYSSTFAMPDNVYIIATFTASGTTATIQENLFGSGGNINAIVLRRLTGLPLAPVITTQPQSANVSAGSTAQFTVGANGTSLTYQWQRAIVGSGTFANVNDANASGATTAQLTITNASAGNVADYRVIVSNGSGSVTSSPAATLNVPSTAVTLLHRWSFNETSGTSALDSISGANGTLQGGANFAGGYAVLPNTGSAGDSAYVSIPGGLLNGLAAVTVECWVTNNGWNNGNTFVGFGGPTDPSGSGTNFINFFARWAGSISAFQIQTTSGDSGIVGLGTRVNYNSATTQPSPAHYVYTYNPSAGTVALYTNGVLSGTATGVTIPLSSLGTSLGTIGRAVWNTNFGATIPTTSGNRPFMNAGVSEVRIYSGVMSSNAVALDFQFGPDQVPPATLKHRWSFNETSGTTAVDSISGANGTLQGGANFAGGYAVLPNTGSASDSAYVSIPGGLLNGLAAVTVECWVTNNGWANGNTFVGFGGPTDPSGSGTNFISFFARWFNAISAFQIQTTAGDSGIVGLGTRVNYNSVTTQPSPAHYVYTYNPAAGTVALYTNGVLSGSATGVTIPLSTLGTSQGTIGRAIWNTNFAASIPGTSGNRPFMNAGVSEVRIYSSILSSNAIAADFQLGPDRLPSVTTTNMPTISVTNGVGSLTLSWPSSSGSFYVESSPVVGPNAIWTLVSGFQTVVGPNNQITLPTTNGAAMFFRLRQ